jgi:hypothetical protein
MISKKRPPYFAYNAQSRFNMTPGIPLFGSDRRADQRMGSDPLISSRPLKAHDLKSGGSPSGEAQLPNQQLGLATMKKYGLTVRRYA